MKSPWLLPAAADGVYAGVHSSSSSASSSASSSSSSSSSLFSPFPPPLKPLLECEFAQIHLQPRPTGFPPSRPLFHPPSSLPSLDPHWRWRGGGAWWGLWRLHHVPGRHGGEEVAGTSARAGGASGDCRERAARGGRAPPVAAPGAAGAALGGPPPFGADNTGAVNRQPSDTGP